MKKTAILYGPAKGSVAKVAKLISNEFSNSHLIEVADAEAEHVSSFDNIIMGLSTVGRSTWDSNHADNEWDVFMGKLGHIDLSGKTVAIYGLGDHLLYPENFVDAMGWLYDKLKRQNITIVGFTDPSGYTFTESSAIRNNLFVGLPVDEDCEPELTPSRISNWVKQLLKEGF